MELHRITILITLSLNLLAIYFGVVFGITPDEAERVARLKQVVTPELLYRDFMQSDEFLLPWLKARNMDPATAAKMLKNALKWRRNNNIDHVLSETNLTCDKYYPSITDAKDKKERPIWQVPMRKWDVRKYTLGTGNVNGFVRCMVQYLELMSEKVRSRTSNVTQFVFIADLIGFNIRQHACVRCITGYIDVIRYYESYYPGLIGMVYLINIPQVFQTTLELGKAAMSQETKKSLRVYGFEKAVWQAALLMDIAEDQLTQDLGGTKRI